ncbi:28434_t:CDS:2 [Dentiscutata erythropus]|uniref:28434_t:CDS:1 n=1 Tax=Dentiscutata erythropus TaxID=1348616 RepID=A0A9N9HUD5_9GLOM|nr:28434_t:CDS:2 [Dentiscutata erythropus]
MSKLLNIFNQLIRPQVDPTIEEEVMINVNIDDELAELKLKKSYNLKQVREELKTKELIEIADKLIFIGRKSGKIPVESEEGLRCADILDEEKNTIYLKRLKWCILGKEFKLGNGRTTTYEVATKRAFIVENCELLKADDPIVDHNETIESREDEIRNRNLLFTTDVEIKNLAKLAVSMGSKKEKQNHFESSSIKKYKKRSKECLKIIKVIPTEEFKNAVKDAIDSKSIYKLERIKDDFGYFIPTIIKFGGIFRYENEALETKHSKNKKKNASIKLGANDQKLELEHNKNVFYEKENKSQREILEVYGGDEEKLKRDKNENAWASSLDDFRKWRPIDFQKPKSIFHYLSEDLQNDIMKLFGKRILYAGEQKLNFVYNDPEQNLLRKLKIPLDIFSNFNDDCQIFATVSNIEDSDIFTYRLNASDKDNVICIHCIQCSQKKKPKNYDIIIRWIVVGYDFDFNYLPSNLSFRLQSFKEKINPKKISESTNNHILKIYERNTSEFFGRDHLLGIPVFKNVESKYDSLVIGSHFCRCNDKINTYIYGYDLYKEKYSTCATLPDLEFNFLHFLDLPDSTIFDQFHIEYPRNNRKKEKIKDFFIRDKNDPKSKFANLYLLNLLDETKCSPKFIGQNKEEFVMHQLGCTCQGHGCENSNHFSEKVIYQAEYFSPNITYERIEEISNYNEN